MDHCFPRSQEYSTPELPERSDLPVLQLYQSIRPRESEIWLQCRSLRVPFSERARLRHHIGSQALTCETFKLNIITFDLREESRTPDVEHQNPSSAAAVRTAASERASRWRRSPPADRSFSPARNKIAQNYNPVAHGGIRKPAKREAVCRPQP